MHRTRMAALLGTATLIATSMLAGGLPAAAAPQSTTIQLLGLNDFHGRLESIGKTADGKEIGGAAQLAGMVKQLRGENPNTAFVAAGDLIGASTFISAVQKDKPTIEALNLMGLDASSVGNHEFDQGFKDLTDRVAPLATYKYLGANVYRGGKPALPESTILTVGGVKVGLVGEVTQDTASLVSPDGIRGLEFRDPTTEANRAAAALRQQGAQAVILLIHEGSANTGTDAATCAAVADPATVFGKIVRGASADIDAIVSGHTHEAYSCSYDVAGLGHTRPVMQGGHYGEQLDQMLITVADGKVTQIRPKLLPIAGYTPDPQVAALVAAAKKDADKVGLVKVGSITADIKRAYTAAAAEDRGAESVLGNFIADVQLDQTSAANRGGGQIALMNPGGLRADLLKGTDGTITYAAAAAVQPFANDIVTQTFTGAQIKKALEQQWQPSTASRPFLKLGVSKGFQYVYDPKAAAGDHIRGITLNGKTVESNATYRVTTNSFLAAGGDNFTVLGEGTQRFATGDNDLTVLVNYLGAHSPVTADTASRALLPDASAGTIPTTASGGGHLPITGINLTSILAAGAALLLLGAGILWYVTRRRRRIVIVND